ncbi:hypothetical protein PBAC_10890 [Pedobacter glucosidilyticus]|nr:T9SS type A sorting domain-containing protein [Pedobacter glucosidilyticus]KHJ38750.1 hypothetical protein PBAC_10890 [Pedobacter glucosidilyticus]
MKRILLILVLLGITLTGFGQGTYYWVGGTTANNLTSGGNWNTQQNGLGTSRVVNAADVLIIDGANIGGTNPTTGIATIIVNGATTAQVRIQNGANVVLVRATSSGTITLANNTVGQPGLFVDATSSLQLGISDNAYTGLVYLDFPTSTALIEGSVKIIQGTSVSGSSRITSRTVGAIVFSSGSSLAYNNSLNYPFGTVGTTTSNSSNYSVVFQSGASLITESIYSPFGSSSTNSIVDFKEGSNFYIRNTMTTGSFTNQKTFANVFIENNATLTTDAAALNKIENLTINSGCNLNVGGSSSTPLPVIGNIVVNGNINGTSPGTLILIMGGNSAQTISGTGNINVANFIVGNHSSVSLNKDITVSSAVNVYGRLNLNNNKINGDASFTSRVNFNPTTSSQTGATVTSGSYQILITTGLGLSSLPGLAISGTGIPANTNIISYSSSNGQINLSKPATATASNVTISFTSNTSTLETSNTTGIDGGILVVGTKNFNNGTDFIFNSTTTAPFATSNNNSLGNVTFNAASTTNTDATINGVLTLNNAKLTIRTGDNLTMSTTSSFAGTSNSAYIVTDANTSTGIVGTLKLAGVLTSKLVPVGSTNNYLPVTLNPTTVSDFSINVFQGTTENGTPNGTAFANKSDIVDAIYNINRTSGTGNCDVSLGWQAGLEGANFSALSDANVGVAKYTGTAFTSFVGPGNNTTNTITTTITDDVFGPFLVGKVGVLPVTLISFTAKASNQTVVLKWKATSEVNLSHYLVQRSIDGLSFETLTSVKANNRSGVFDYGFIDQFPSFGANYYQLVSVDIDGKTSTSSLQVVSLGAPIILSVYPNPTHETLYISGLNNGDIVRVVDLLGKILNVEQSNSANLMNLNIGNVNSGIYSVLVLRNGKIISSNKIVKN